eukprot:15430896-Alexandrium_andersonii.AAC.1
MVMFCTGFVALSQRSMDNYCQGGMSKVSVQNAHACTMSCMHALYTACVLSLDRGTRPNRWAALRVNTWQ